MSPNQTASDEATAGGADENIRDTCSQTEPKMKTKLNALSWKITRSTFAPSIAVLLTLTSLGARAAAPALVLDDYSDPKLNKNGVQRLLVDDKGLGSSSKATQKCEKGVLSVKGDLTPGRGLPAFISHVSLLSLDGKPKDLSAYKGVCIRVKVIKGILCVQVASSEIQNYDYHTSAPISGKSGEFQEVRISFTDMKRAWSEQTALNLKSITSVNLVSFGMAKDSFAYEVRELGFY